MMRLSWRWASLPLGVTGNTPDSGSGESWFDPRRGNSKRDARIKRVALLVFSGPTSVLQAFAPAAPSGICPLLAADFPVPEFHRRAHHLEHPVRRRQLIAAQQRLRVLPPASRHHVHDRHVLSLSRPLSPERMEATALQMRQTRMPLHAIVQLAEDLPGPVIVLVGAREQPPVTNRRELHFEAAKFFGQRFGDWDHPISAPLVELRLELDLGRVEADIRPTEATDRPDARPGRFRQHERQFPTLPTFAPALLRCRSRHLLRGRPELQEP